MLNNTRIAIIGYGKFGQVLYHFLVPQKNTCVFTPHREKYVHDVAVPFCATLKEAVANAELIIPCVPIRTFETVIKQIAPLLKPGTVVMDVSSVKMHPAQVMQTYLPSHTHIIATHPMFGPSSLQQNNNDLTNFTIMIYKVRSPQSIYEAIRQYLQQKGLRIAEMTPEAHDKIQSQTQFVAQTVRWSLQEANVLTPSDIDTPSVTMLRKAMSLMDRDQTLYEDMLRYNPWCKKVVSRMIKALQKFERI